MTWRNDKTCSKEAEKFFFASELRSCTISLSVFRNIIWLGRKIKEAELSLLLFHFIYNKISYKSVNSFTRTREKLFHSNNFVSIKPKLSSEGQLEARTSQSYWPQVVRLSYFNAHRRVFLPNTYTLCMQGLGPQHLQRLTRLHKETFITQHKQEEETENKGNYNPYIFVWTNQQTKLSSCTRTTTFVHMP